MSLLGHDAVGHWALGHPPDGAGATTLTVSAGAYTITGFPVSFTIQEAIASASFAITGAISFTIKEPIAAGALSISGNPISFSIAENAAAAAYTITGYPINEIVLEAEGPASIQITGNDAPLHRTGDNYEFKLGGVGHLKWEMEEARRLAAITRRSPPGFVDLRSQPSFPSFGGPSIAPAVPGPDLQAIADQRMQAEMQAAQKAAKQRRDIEAILLLAA